MADDALELVKLRNNFYRDNYRRVVGALLIMLVIIVALVGTVFYQLSTRPEPRYFATSSDGRITPIYALNDPVVNTEDLLQWAVRAAVAANCYNFVDYREKLQQVQNYFTPDGWKYFETALQGARTLETVIAKKLVVSAVATGTPVIIDQGVINGRYAWKVQLPLLVTYQSPNELTQQPVMATMIVTRVPTLNVPRGIAIASFVESITSAQQQ
jgi:intracellular multiplication protein IcmL